MKKIFLLLLITIFLSGCERDYIKNNTLPPLTYTGADTAGCLVNGEVFVPKGEWYQRKLECHYSYSIYYQEARFILSIYQRGKEVTKDITISCYNLGLLHENIGVGYSLDTENFVLDSGGTGYYSLYYYNSLSNNTSYVTKDNFKGELVITFFDSEKNIISGTFWFDAVNSEGEVMEVRDGRFDMKYIEY